MRFKIDLRDAAALTAAFVILGANVEWNPVEAVPVSKPEKVAEMCSKVTVDTYGYCCKLRLESTCPAAGSKAVRQSFPLKMAEARDNEDIGSQGISSVFVNGNTEAPGRGLGANNGGNDGDAGAANMGGNMGNEGGNNGGNMGGNFGGENGGGGDE